MGKIFGISDLPVSTIDKAIQSTQMHNNVERKVLREVSYQSDKFVGKPAKKISKTFVAMRNGIGKLMSHFSKKLVK